MTFFDLPTVTYDENFSVKSARIRVINSDPAKTVIPIRIRTDNTYRISYFRFTVIRNLETFIGFWSCAKPPFLPPRPFFCTVPGMHHRRPGTYLLL